MPNLVTSRQLDHMLDLCNLEHKILSYLSQRASKDFNGTKTEVCYLARGCVSYHQRDAPPFIQERWRGETRKSGLFIVAKLLQESKINIVVAKDQ